MSSVCQQPAVKHLSSHLSMVHGLNGHELPPHNAVLWFIEERHPALGRDATFPWSRASEVSHNLSPGRQR